MQPTIVLHSAMSPDSVVARLRDSVDERRRTLFSLSGYKGRGPIIGKVDERTFRLQKRRYWHNDFAPFFYGQISSEGNGSRIDGYFGHSSTCKVVYAHLAFRSDDHWRTHFREYTGQRSKGEP